MLGHNSAPDWVRNPSGWIAVSRDIRNHPLVGFGLNVPPADPSRGSANRNEAWQDLIMMASFKPQAVVNRGRETMLDVGQLVGARSWLANRWNWSEKTVRWFLHALADDGMITWSNQLHTQPHPENGSKQGPATGPAPRPAQGPANRAAGQNACNVITICNYMDYQFAVTEIERYVDGIKGQQYGQQRGQQKGQNITKETNSKIPPTPQGGQAEEPFRLEGEPAEKAGKISQADIDEAYRCYNIAAKHLGFSDCRNRSPARTRLLARRLKDIGGLEAFKVALNHIRHDEFLAGRVPGKDGRKSFQLSFDTLLSPKLGQIGDVLARLLDIAGERAALRQATDNGVLIASEEELVSRDRRQWLDELDVYANGRWVFARLGPSPASTQCKVLPELIEELRLVDYYDIMGNLKPGMKPTWSKGAH